MAEKILSIFIDESGDFGAYDTHAPYYIVTMVLHNQSDDIEENILNLNTHVFNLGYSEHAIHVGPLIRRESVYQNYTYEERRKLFSALFNFARKLPFSYIIATVKKQECPDEIALTAKISKSVANVLKQHADYFESFDKIIVYYDNGQNELTKILTSVFNTLFSNVEFRKVSPVEYKLFQVADLICTMELLINKAEINNFSKSEKEFFGSVRDYKKNFYKTISKKHI